MNKTPLECVDALVKEGMTALEIAKQLGVHPANLSQLRSNPARGMDYRLVDKLREMVEEKK